MNKKAKSLVKKYIKCLKSKLFDKKSSSGKKGACFKNLYEKNLDRIW